MQMTFKEIRDRASSVWRAFTELKRPRILLGTATCGRAAGGDALKQVFQTKMAEKKIEADIYDVGCIGMCYAEPLVEIATPGGPRVLYSSVTPEIAAQLVDERLARGGLCKERAMAVVGGPGVDGIPAFEELPVQKRQVRIILKNCGFIDPENIDHYIAGGGYSGLAKALSMSSQQVIDEVKKSGLRGRGGAGFPTGQKWEFCSKSPGTEKYVICNADEGDPGAFMNRSVLESDTHAVLEGMVIAGYAIGAHAGYVYCRAEYPLAIDRLKCAIGKMEEYGFLGDSVMGSGFGFHIKIKQGAGAFVCGEETALMASIEGKRGMPRPRPPFPAQAGVFGKPTNINNVETLAAVSQILARGAAWYAGYGTEKSRGTKTFALAGKVVRTGLIEVPFGIHLREIIYDIGGGVLGDKKFKAVQTGGPSGGCLPANLLDLPVDYEALTAAGSIMGSGGMIVMDEETCTVDIARYFLDFTRNESCGKCVPCRLGTRQMLQILEHIQAGRASDEDLSILEDVGHSVRQASLCGLGQTAPNPALTTLRYFREEYDAHVRRKECPAGVCKDLMHYFVANDTCTGCGACAKACPSKAIAGEKKKPHSIDQGKCIKCGVCVQTCKFDSLNRVPGQYKGSMDGPGRSPV